ncbi:MAG: DEAD/DEAH box helicase [Alphaproteobacteria bacterium]
MAEPVLRALSALNLTHPTPIQQDAIPVVLDGLDVVGVAQTGTGKTAAFGLPLLHRLAAESRRPAPRSARALILAPTRELALQIEESLRGFARHLRLRICPILGGVARRPQASRLAGGVDIVVGTPGRVVDLMSTDELRLGSVACFVLDEADRMLDLGFARDIRKIALALPDDRQTLMFSATMPAEVTRLAQALLRDPVHVAVSKTDVAPAAIAQQVYFVANADKRGLLNRLLGDPDIARAIVFTRTKHGANRVAKHLVQGGTRAEAIHGNKSQSARQGSLARFRDGSARVLVATDIAARGIDVADVSHVINFDLPVEVDSYVHRIGRTARAGASGTAITFCDAAEHAALREIERRTGLTMTVAGGTPPTQSCANTPRTGKGRPRAGGQTGQDKPTVTHGGPRKRRSRVGQRKGFQAAA